MRSYLASIVALGLLATPAMASSQPDCDMRDKDCREQFKQDRKAMRGDNNTARSRVGVGVESKTTSSNTLEQGNTSILEQGSGATIRALPHSSVTTTYGAEVGQSNKGAIDSYTGSETKADTDVNTSAGR